MTAQALPKPPISPSAAQTPSYSLRWKVLAFLLLAVSVFAGIEFGFWPGALAFFGSGLIIALGKPLRRFSRLIYRGLAPAAAIGIALGALVDFVQHVVQVETPLGPIALLVIGVILGAVVVDGAIELYALIRMHWILSLSPGIDPKEGRRVLRQLYLGINYPVLMVKDGVVETTKAGGAGGILQKIGGPGLMFVHHGNAVVLERTGKFTKVVRGGVTMLRLYEQPRAVVDMRRKQETLRVDDVLTCDGVSLRVELILWYQIRRTDLPPAPAATAKPPPKPHIALWQRPLVGLAELFWALARQTPPTFDQHAGGPAREVTGENIGERDEVEIAEDAAAVEAPAEPIDQYNVADQDIINAVYLTDDWERGVKAMAGAILRDIVAERPLDTLIEYGRTQGELLPRNEIRESLMRRLNWFLEQERWGVEIIWCDIATVNLPEAARKRMLEKWEAEWEARTADAQKQATIARGEATAVAAGAQEAARARATMQMLAALRTAVQGEDGDRATADELDRIVKLRLIDALEKMAGEHASGMFLPSSLLDLLATRENPASRGGGPSGPPSSNGDAP